MIAVNILLITFWFNARENYHKQPALLKKKMKTKNVNSIMNSMMHVYVLVHI